VLFLSLFPAELYLQPAVELLMPGGGAAAAEEAKKDGGREQRRSKTAAAHHGLEKFSVGSTYAHSHCLPSVANSVLTRHRAGSRPTSGTRT